MSRLTPIRTVAVLGATVAATLLVRAAAPDPAAAALQPPAGVERIEFTAGPAGYRFQALAAGNPAAAADGRLILLLHGYPQSPASFQALLPALADAGYYAVAPALRGYSPGASPAATSEYAIEAMAPEVVMMAAALGASRFHLVGHDWGGGLAWSVATAVPDRVLSLTALSTPHPDALGDAVADRSTQQALRLSYIKVFRTRGIEHVLLAFGPEFFARALHALGAPLPLARVYAQGLGTPSRLSRALNWYRANPVPARIRLGVTRVPTTFVWGTRDFAFTRESAERTAHYVDAPYRFVALPEGHFLSDRHPAAIADLILERVGSVHAQR